LSELVVWSWSLDDHRLHGGDAEELLSAAERGRAHRFVDALHQRRFAASRVGLRRILGAHMSVDPAAIEFAENAFGKPHILGHPLLNFSLSHSGDQAALAIREGSPVGIDIEHVRALEHRDIALRYFRANEAAWIERRPTEEEQRRAFFQTWTLKEAMAKAVGKGMSLSFSDFEVSAADAPPRVIVVPPGASDRWRLLWLDAPAGYLCALAAPDAADVGVTQRTY
jgi:4'-phosphopantetheinyl transferase